MPVEPAPAVRSFKRRSRIRSGQEQALTDLWPRYGVPPDGGALDQQGLFGRRSGLVVEIGFGFGEAALAMAAADPGRDLLAVDVHRAGAGALLREVAAAGLTNVRVLLGDAVPVLRDRIGVGSLDEVRIYFPDPWPKTRHHKRRLVSGQLVALVAARLRPAGSDHPADPGGRLHLATDWAHYAAQMLATIEAENLLRNEFDGYAPGSAGRPSTRFERRGVGRGHEVFDLLARRRVLPAPAEAAQGDSGPAPIAAG